jgi:hypothetical protein
MKGINSWLISKIDQDTRVSHITTVLHNMVKNHIINLGFEIKDSDRFRNQFLLFLYKNSSVRRINRF